jgi:iron complex transport system ATP-binding protein
MSVRVDNLGFAYHDIPVLTDITFRAAEGQLMAVLGRNGSGKTTLLKTLNRIHKPNKGCVLIDDVDVGRMTRSQIAERVGYMPQAQEPVHCTVFEAVLLGRKARHAGASDEADLRKVEEVLDMVRLKHLAMRSTLELSGGELQKVILGRALAQEPRVLLLDEPISHLDPVSQIEVMSLLHEVTKGLGMTSLLVTHDLNSALRFADAFILLKDGRVLAQGDQGVLTPESIKSVYGIDVMFSHVAGIPVLVPLLKEVRPHQHIHTHEHVHKRADGTACVHTHAHSHSHTHSVDDHVYDHPHPDEHGSHAHTHQPDKQSNERDKV